MKIYDLNESDDFLRYPTDNIVAVFNNETDLARAIHALNIAGYEENDVAILSGPEGAKRLDISGEQHGWLARVYRFMESAAAESKKLHQFAEELKAGHFVVFVHASNNEERSDLWSIMKAHGAHRAAWFGKWIIEKVA
jgi:hypothetical protein